MNRLHVTPLRGFDDCDHFRGYWSPLEEQGYVKIKKKYPNLKDKINVLFPYLIIVYSLTTDILKF